VRGPLHILAMSRRGTKVELGLLPLATSTLTQDNFWHWTNTLDFEREIIDHNYWTLLMTGLASMTEGTWYVVEITENALACVNALRQFRCYLATMPQSELEAMYPVSAPFGTPYSGGRPPSYPDELPWPPPLSVVMAEAAIPRDPARERATGDAGREYIQGGPAVTLDLVDESAARAEVTDWSVNRRKAVTEQPSADTIEPGNPPG